MTILNQRLFIIDNINKKNIELDKVNNNSWYITTLFKNNNYIKYINIVNKNYYNTKIIGNCDNNVINNIKITDNNFEIKGNYIIKKNVKSNNINKEQLINNNVKIGIVITTNGYNGVYIKQCIECYIRELPPNRFIVLYINESKDEITLDLKNKFKEIHVIYIKDQTANGGLTGTWNQGIDLCFKNNCDIIALSNDDIFFNDSINNILFECYNNKDKLNYYGPVTNNPGPAKQNQLQYNIKSENKENKIAIYNNKLVNLNGFFMVFSRKVLLENKFNNQYYFDPSKPFGGNEVEWFNRFILKGGNPIIVPRTFIYHYKNASWKKGINTNKNNICLYTINTGNYEENEINLNTNLGYDCLYFTDNFNLVPKLINKDIKPFYVNPYYCESKLLQRIIKTLPHYFLPNQYNKSIYIDGNIVIKNNLIHNYLKLNHDIICFSHPLRDSVLRESFKVIKLNLEYRTNVINIINKFKKNKFKDNIGLTETNILIRNHNKIKNFNKEWYECIKICKRDQISFDYLLFKYKINYKKFSYNDKIKIIYKNKHKNSVYRKVN